MITRWVLDRWWSSDVSLFSRLVSPIGYLYQFLSSVRRYLYLKKILPSQAVSIPVIVVGNIVVGGSGKTPITIALVKHFQTQGLKVAVLSRGYGTKITGSIPLVVDGQYYLTSGSGSKAPDEPQLIYMATGVSVYCHPNRVVAATAAISDGAGLLICDDGLQHYALRRDIEIVIHPKAPAVGNGLHMPAGPLRESVSRAEQAAYQLSVTSQSEPVFGLVQQYEYSPKSFINCLTGDTACLSNFSAVKAVAFAGIAKPENFFNTLKESSVDVIEAIPFEDHYSYQLSDIDKLLGSVLNSVKSDFDGKLVVFMTQKDQVKCKHFLSRLAERYSQYKIEFWVLEMQVVLPHTFLNQITADVRQLTSAERATL